MKMRKETRDMYTQSINTQVQQIVGNGMTCCDNCDNAWQLWNDNYYQMVSMLINVVKTLSQLHIEAPEWYPMEQLADEGEVKLGAKMVSTEKGP